MTEFMILLLILLVIILLIFCRPCPRVVPEGHRLVVYRWGRVARIVGPGLVWTFHSLESVAKAPLDVRSQHLDMVIPDVLINGVPVGITFGLWFKFDPVEAAADQKDVIASLVQFSEAERRKRLRGQLQEALFQALAAVAERYPPPKNVTIIENLMPVLPATPQYTTLLDALTTELRATLPRLGIILDQQHQIIIGQIQLPDGLSQGFERDRAAALLRSRFPNLTDDRIAAMLSAIEGKQLPVKTVVFEGAASLPKEVRLVEDDIQMLEDLDYGAKEPAKPPIVQPEPMPSSSPGKQATGTDDWAVLKSMPPYVKRRPESS